MTITDAVDVLKEAAMKLSEAQKNLIAAKKVLERAKELESAARGKYALALDDLEGQTGVE